MTMVGNGRPWPTVGHTEIHRAAHSRSARGRAQVYLIEQIRTHLCLPGCFAQTDAQLFHSAPFCSDDQWTHVSKHASTDTTCRSGGRGF
jgi:hypothetical protein